MERINYSPPMTLHLVKNEVFSSEPFSLIDVGASGGIAPHWSVFGDHCCAVGFEPLLAECEKLNREKQKKITYFPYFIKSDDKEVCDESGNHYTSRIFNRTSAAFYSELKKYNYAKEHFNSGNEPIYSDKNITIDQFVAINPIKTIDFIKIDTDGNDYEVLHSAKHVFSNEQVLGIEIESQFHGKTHPHSNAFRNIDRFLTELGFSLFDLDVYRYSRRDLPGRFYYPIPAQTTTGQVMWGNALYLRDIASETLDLPPLKIIKLACLQELFQMPDCAAELLNVYKDKIIHLIDVEKCLDLLAKSMGMEQTYNAHIRHFKEQPHNFCPQQPLPRLSPIRNLLSKLLRKNHA